MIYLSPGDHIELIVTRNGVPYAKTMTLEIDQFRNNSVSLLGFVTLAAARLHTDIEEDDLEFPVT